MNILGHFYFGITRNVFIRFLAKELILLSIMVVVN